MVSPGHEPGGEPPGEAVAAHEVEDALPLGEPEQALSHDHDRHLVESRRRRSRPPENAHEGSRGRRRSVEGTAARESLCNPVTGVTLRDRRPQTSADCVLPTARRRDRNLAPDQPAPRGSLRWMHYPPGTRAPGGRPRCAPTAMPRTPRRRRPDRVRPGRGPALRERRDARDPAAARRPRLQLRRTGRPTAPRPGDAGPDPEPRDPAGVHRRLDLPHPQRPHPGHRPGRARAEAVPLPPAVARGPRRDQVRPDAGLQRGAAAAPRSGSRRTWPARAAAGEGAGHRGPAARVHRHPGGQRRVRPDQPLVRAHHAAGPPRGDLRARRLRFEFRGKSGKIAPGRAQRPAARAHRGALPGAAGRGAVPVRGRRRASGRRSARAT